MSEISPTPRTVAFIHGSFVTRHCWDAWVARFESRGYRCTAIAYPGRTQSVAELRAKRDDPFLRRLTLEAVIEHHVQALRALPEKPIIIGHSFGGLLTQLMLQRDLGAAAVTISSVPPQGVFSFAWSFLRSLAPIVNPLAGSRPYFMSFPHFQYRFGNDLSLADQKAGWEADIVPESRPLARGGLSKAARVDFARKRAPLLMIAAEKDHIMPASLNRRNYRRYGKSPSVTDFKQFPGRAHYSVIAGKGWEEVADYALEWALSAARRDSEVAGVAAASHARARAV
jgi:pimeloyl-ACP methyl ester carboxylesterase